MKPFKYKITDIYNESLRKRFKAISSTALPDTAVPYDKTILILSTQMFIKGLEDAHSKVYYSTIQYGKKKSVHILNDTYDSLISRFHDYHKATEYLLELTLGKIQKDVFEYFVNGQLHISHQNIIGFRLESFITDWRESGDYSDIKVTLQCATELIYHNDKLNEDQKLLFVTSGLINGLLSSEYGHKSLNEKIKDFEIIYDDALHRDLRRPRDSMLPTNPYVQGSKTIELRD